MAYCHYDIALFNQTFLNIKNIYQGRLNGIIGPGQNSALSRPLPIQPLTGIKM